MKKISRQIKLHGTAHMVFTGDRTPSNLAAFRLWRTFGK